MIPTQTEYRSELVISTALEEYDTSINVDPNFLMEIFDTGIYKDPIRAFVQEITANALDANVESGTSKKVVVTLPTVKSPEFKVRDYGIGISPTRMTEVYLKYLSSTKKTSNEYYGIFGSGSKTPFAYTNSFMIRTIVEGVEYFYVYSKETTSKPLKLLSKLDTEELDGTEITIPIKSKDIDSVVKAFKDVFAFSSNKINCSIPTLLDKFELIDKGNHYIVKSINRYYDIDYQVLVGNIPYKLNADALNLSFNIKKFISSSDILLKTSIGEVSIVYSKDEIKYDEPTKTKLAELCVEVYDQVKKELEGLNSKTSLLDIHNNLSTIRNHYSGINCLDLNLILHTYPIALYAESVGIEVDTLSYSRSISQFKGEFSFCRFLKTSKLQGLDALYYCKADEVDKYKVKFKASGINYITVVYLDETDNFYKLIEDFKVPLKHISEAVKTSTKAYKKNPAVVKILRLSSDLRTAKYCNLDTSTITDMIYIAEEAIDLDTRRVHNRSVISQYSNYVRNSLDIYVLNDNHLAKLRNLPIRLTKLEDEIKLQAECWAHTRLGSVDLLPVYLKYKSRYYTSYKAERLDEIEKLLPEFSDFIAMFRRILSVTNVDVSRPSYLLNAYQEIIPITEESLATNPYKDLYYFCVRDTTPSIVVSAIENECYSFSSNLESCKEVRNLLDVYNSKRLSNSVPIDQ